MQQDLARLIGETTDYDKKQELETRRPKSWCKSVSAFANGRGGALVFGVADDGTVCGLERPQEAAERFSETVHDKLDPVPEFRLHFEQVEGRTVMVVDVERGELTPYYYIGDGQQQAFVRVFCTRWNGLDKAHGLMDALDDEEIAGSLIIQLQDGLNFCRRNARKRWYKTPDGRVELPDYPENCVQEGLVNALVHRSYLELGSEVHIDIYDDRMEIYSPGGMYESRPVQECDIMNVPSRRRNPVVADIFARINYMERRGSGFRKICDLYTSQKNYRPELRPRFHSDNYGFVLTLFNLNYGAEEGAELAPVADEHKNTVGQRANAQESEHEHESGHEHEHEHERGHALGGGRRFDYDLVASFLELLKCWPNATVMELMRLANLSQRKVKYCLAFLRDIGAIRRVGTQRKGSWLVLKDTID